MAPILTPEDVIRRIAAECTFVDERGAVGIRFEPAAAIARQYGNQFRKSWTELAGTRQRALLTALIERIDVRSNQIDIHFHSTRLGALLDVVTVPLLGATEDENQILSVPVQRRRRGREIRMLIDGTDPFATAKPDARLVKLLIRARRFNATLLDSDGVPFAALAQREGVSPSYFTRLVRLSYLAPEITAAILDGRQPHDLNADKLLAHSRLPLAWHEQRTVLGFA